LFRILSPQKESKIGQNNPENRRTLNFERGLILFLMKRKSLLLIALSLLLILFGVCSHHQPTPQVYDCFLFFNELELLEIRLHEMAPYVDHFVIVEANETFRGAPKPYYFAENRERFAQFADKIIHIQLEEHLETDNPWIRERYQRQQVFRGLKNCNRKDIIFLSDVDEIVRGSLIPTIVEKITSQEMQAIVCRQKMYFGYMNRFQATWSGSVCTTFERAKKLSAKKMRRLRNMQPRLLRKTHISKMCTLDQAGWHFTSMGGMERYIRKLQSYSHVEADTSEAKTETHRSQIINAFTLEPIDETFPQFVRDHQAHLEAIGFLEPVPHTSH